jgi:hypothetical protein
VHLRQQMESDSRDLWSEAEIRILIKSNAGTAWLRREQRPGTQSLRGCARMRSDRPTRGQGSDHLAPSKLRQCRRSGGRGRYEINTQGLHSKREEGVAGFRRKHIQGRIISWVERLLFRLAMSQHQLANPPSPPNIRVST